MLSHRRAVPSALLSLGICVGACSSPHEEPEQRPATPSSASATPVSTTRPIGVQGLVLDVPRSFVALEDERTSQLRAAALAQEPESQVTINAVRDPNAIDDGMAYVMRGDLPDKPAQMHGSVREALERMGAEMRVQLEISGVKVERFDTHIADDAIELGTVATMTKGSKTVELHLTALVFVNESKRVTLLTAACMQAAGKDVCAPLLARHHYDREARLKEDTLLGPPVPKPGDFLGFAWGSSPKDFAATCAKNHLTAIDPAAEPAEVAALVKRGELVECKGSATSPYGKVVHIGGQFAKDALEALVVDLDEPGATVQEVLDKAYAGPVATPDGTRLVQPAAKGLELFAMRIGPPSVDGARSTLLFATRNAWDRAFNH